MVGKITRDLEGHIGRLHGDDVPDDTGSANEQVRAVVAHVKSKSGLPYNFPSALVEDYLEHEVNSDPHADTVAERARNPVELEMMLNRAGHGLRAKANDLIRATRPSTELPWGLKPADLPDLNDQEWARLKRHMAHMYEAGKRR